MIRDEKTGYILFDLNGQNVAVTDLNIDSQGRLKMAWVVMDKEKKFEEDEIERMLNDAFAFILRNMSEPE